MSLRPDQEPLSAALCSLQLLCAFLKGVGKGGLGCGTPERSLWSLAYRVWWLRLPSVAPYSHFSVPCAWREDTAQ